MHILFLLVVTLGLIGLFLPYILVGAGVALAAILGLAVLFAVIAVFIADPSGFAGLALLAAVVTAPLLAWQLILGAKARRELAAIRAIEEARQLDAWRKANLDECEHARRAAQNVLTHESVAR